MFGRFIITGTNISYSVPVITSTNYDLDDTLGGSSIVIAGTNFLAVTNVFFGVTAATSFTIDSDIQITAVVPAHTAGSINITVVNTIYTSNGFAFEFWSPITPGNVTSFMESPDYSTPGGQGLWTARYGIGSNLTANAPDDDPTGTPNFISANLDRLTGPSTSWSNLIGTSSLNSGTIACILDVTDLTGIASNIICDDSFFGTIFLTPTPDASFYYHTGGVYVNATVSIPSSGRIILIAERDSSGIPFIKITNMTSDVVNWTNGGNVGNLDASAAGISLGYFTAANLYPYNGRMRTLVTATTGWSDANVIKFYKWANIRHP